MDPIKIYADFNGLVFNPETRRAEGVVLDTFGSLRDLSNAGVVLREGLPLICIDASDEKEDLEAEGIAEFNCENGWWILKFNEDWIKDVPAGDRTPINEFLCVSCRKDLGPEIKSKKLSTTDICPSCNTPIMAAVAKPS